MEDWPALALYLVIGGLVTGWIWAILDLILTTDLRPAQKAGWVTLLLLSAIIGLTLYVAVAPFQKGKNRRLAKLQSTH